MRYDYYALGAATRQTGSGFRGVEQMRGRNLFRARLYLRGQQRTLGYFPSAGEAAESYDCALIYFHRHLARRPHAESFNVADPHASLNDFSEQAVNRCREVEEELITENGGNPLPVYREARGSDRACDIADARRNHPWVWHGVQRVPGGFSATIRLYGIDWDIGTVASDVLAARLHDAAVLFFRKHVPYNRSVEFRTNNPLHHIRPTEQELGLCAELAERVTQEANDGKDLPVYSTSGLVSGHEPPDYSRMRHTTLCRRVAMLQARTEQLEATIRNLGGEVPKDPNEHLLFSGRVFMLTPEQIEMYMREVPPPKSAASPAPPPAARPAPKMRRKRWKVASTPGQWFNLGCRCAWSYGREEDCPYKEGTEQHKHWIAGFAYGVERDRERARRRLSHAEMPLECA